MKKLLALTLGFLLFISPVSSSNITTSDFGINESTSTMTVVVEKPTVEIVLDKTIEEIAAEAIPAIVVVEVDHLINNPFTGEIYVAPSFGAGFFINDKGHLITNYHVVDNRMRIRSGFVNPRIIYKDGDEEKTVYAEILAVDPKNDIALLKLHKNTPSPNYLEFADSDECEIGQKVVAIGHPLGYKWTLTTGVVSAEARKSSNFIEEVIQTTAPLNPGNSGGPLLDLQSRIIGMNTYIVTSNWSSSFSGLGFAVSSNQINKFLDKYRI